MDTLWNRYARPAGIVARPGTSSEWTRLLGRTSGLVLALAAHARDGHLLPAALTPGTLLRSMTVLQRCAREGRPAPTADVERLETAARVLGLSLARCAATPVVAVLVAEAAVHDVAPEQLVAELATLGGIAGRTGPAAARVLWQAAAP